jgi:hypothetical protein
METVDMAIATRGGDGRMGDIPHKTTIAAPTTALYSAFTEQHHPESSPHSVSTSRRATELIS